MERQFQLTSTKSSIIPASHDIGALALILFISFISGRTNKITWIASGSLMLALGSLLFIVPHIATEYQYHGKGIILLVFTMISISIVQCLKWPSSVISDQLPPKGAILSGPKVIKLFFMLNSAEY